MIRVDCLGFEGEGLHLCNQINTVIAKMAPERRVIGLSITTHQPGCEHEKGTSLVYFVIEEIK